MAFPSDPLGAKVELKLNNVWTDVVRYDDDTKILQKNGISIRRGQGGLQLRTPPGTCEWTWNDPNGIYNNENPRSPYYGLLSRNVPVRVSVPRETPALLIVDRNDGARAQTTDKAALDITGDIEVRIDFEPRRFARWASGTNKAMILCSKHAPTSANRSWYLRFGESGVDGSVTKLSFNWSTTGANSLSASATDYLPTTGRIAVKVTMDVNNGGGSREVKFWTSTTGIDGTYTQLGSTVTGATTSIFSSTANVELGTVDGGVLDGEFSALIENFVGRIYAFQLWNGISGSGGTLVAEADFTAQTNGATSFADGLGNTWTTHGVAEITDADYRFHGELSAPVIKPKRSVDGTGLDVTVDAEAGGLIRRLQANKTPLQSPVYLAFSDFGSHGWWPGEDSSSSDDTLASSAVTGVRPATISDITFAGFDSTLAGSAGVMECGATAPTFVGQCKPTTTQTETHFIGYFYFPAIPATESVIFTIYSDNGTVKKWTWSTDADEYFTRGYDASGTEIVTKSSGHGIVNGSAAPDQWVAWHLQLTNSAGTISIKSEWMVINTGVTYTQNSIGTTSYAGNNGTFSRVVVQGSGATYEGMRFAHPMCATTNVVFWDGSDPTFAKFSSGWPGEYADQRFIRICELLGVVPVIIGDTENSEQMGVQPLDTGINVLYECAEVDGAVIIEAVDQLALEFRTRKSLYNQYGISLEYAALADQLEVAPDDTDVANDIIAERTDGGQARATLEYGPMSIQAPPNGINPVPDQPPFNAYTLDQLPFLAQAALHRRTWPEARYPLVGVNMHHPTFAGDATLFLDAASTNIADVITVTDLPLFMPPENLQLLVKGISEEIFSQEWYIYWDMIPYGPYISAELQDITGDTYSDFKAAHTTIDGVVQQQLNAAIDDNDTSIAVKTLDGPLFTTGAVDFMIKIGGEYLNVTNISGASSPQTLTVTRGMVASYAAAHSENDYVYVYPTLKARL
jgi:hypothetical protein